MAIRVFKHQTKKGHREDFACNVICPAENHSKDYHETYRC